MIVRILIIFGLLAGIYGLVRLYLLLLEERWKHRRYEDTKKKKGNDERSGADMDKRRPG